MGKFCSSIGIWKQYSKIFRNHNFWIFFGIDIPKSNLENPVPQSKVLPKVGTHHNIGRKLPNITTLEERGQTSEQCRKVGSHHNIGGSSSTSQQQRKVGTHHTIGIKMTHITTLVESLHTSQHQRNADIWLSTNNEDMRQPQGLWQPQCD